MNTNLRKTIGQFISTLLTTLAFVALAPRAFAQSAVPLWTNRYDNGFPDYATAIAVDGNGNVFVTGYSHSSPSFSSADYATVAYSSTGLPIWTNRYNGPFSTGDRPRAVTVSSNGNVFVTGQSAATFNSSGVATLAYSNAGVPLWTNRYGDEAGSIAFPTAMVADNGGNVFVTGSENVLDGNGNLVFTIKISNGGATLWTNRYPGSVTPGLYNDTVSVLAVGSNGNVFVTANSIGSSGDEDFATVAYSSAGVPLWTNRYDGPAHTNDYPNAIAVDSSGNVFVTGNSANGESPYNPFISYEYATIKYSSAGVPLWTNRYGKPGFSGGASAMALDKDGNVFVAGYSISTNNLFDYATIKYSNAGAALWTNNQAYASGGWRITVRSNGVVLIATPGGTTALSNDGALLWTIYYDFIGPATAVLDSAGNAIVAGWGQSFADSTLNYVTIKYAPTPPIHLAIERDGSGGLFIRYTGAPDVIYRLQRAASVTGTWTNLATNTAPASGLIEYHETSPPPGQAFYRAVQP